MGPTDMEIEINDWRRRHPDWDEVAYTMNPVRMGFDVILIRGNKRVKFFLPHDITNYDAFFRAMIVTSEETDTGEAVDIPKSDLVIHPEHYNKNGRKECWDEMIDVFGPEATMIFDLLSAFKYDYRKGDKEGNPIEQEKRKICNYEDHAQRLVKENPGEITLNSLGMKVLTAYRDYIYKLS